MDRVNGELAMSRALGDYQYKQNEGLGTSEQMVSCYPDISVYVRKDEDDVMVLACDGIWDVMSNVEAVSYIQEGLLADDDGKQQGETEVCLTLTLTLTIRLFIFSTCLIVICLFLLVRMFVVALLVLIDNTTIPLIPVCFGCLTLFSYDYYSINP